VVEYVPPAKATGDDPAAADADRPNGAAEEAAA
jgi:hypothetical protein